MRNPLQAIAMLFGVAACTEMDPVELEPIHGPPPALSPEMRKGFLLETPAYYGVAPADFDGDGKADLSIKLDGGTWKIDYSWNGFVGWDAVVMTGAAASAVPVPGRYDDGDKAVLAVVEENHWLNENHWRIDLDAGGTWDRDITLGFGARAFGRPVPADYDGDGILDLAIRNLEGEWLIDYSADGYTGWDVIYDQFQDLAGEAAAADYDGDGRADLAVKDREGAWHVDYSGNFFGNIDATYTGWGDATWHAVPADYNGDGYADLAVKWDAGVWMIDFARPGALADEATRFEGYDVLYSNAGGTTARAVPADYDGDGKADLAVRVDCGSWFVDGSVGGLGAWEHAYDVGSHDVFTVPSFDGEAKLQAVLDSDFTGTIFVPSYISLYLTWHRNMPVKSCVRIRGTRQGLSEGPLLEMDDADESAPKEWYSMFLVTGHDVTIDGLRLRGPQVGNDSDQDGAVGVQVMADSTRGIGGNVLFDNNEASSWPGAALGVTGPLLPKTQSVADVPVGAPVMSPDDAGLIRATRNNFHDNSRDSYGYGVGVGQGAYVTIEGNVFTYNRHAVASGNEPHTGYVARFNYILEGGFTEGSGYYNQHFDVHGASDDGYGGIAGETYEIASNTIRGEQDYGLEDSRPAFTLRGTPTIGASFHDNVVVHDGPAEAVQIKKAYECFVPYPFPHYDNALCHLTVGPNLYDTDTTDDLAVGDFDGDGRDDIFIANRTAWWYSSAGITEWQFLRASTLGIRDLRFGKFDADAKTDVVFATANDWQFSSGGTAEPVLLRVGGTPLTECVFGDFDGNGITDAVRTYMGTWMFSHDSRTIWSPVRTSPVKAADLRVGNFDRQDPNDEIFVIESAHWSIWNHGSTTLQLLPVTLTTSISGLVVGDFDGDNRSDIAQTSGNKWRYSPDASGAWTPLRDSSTQTQYSDITQALLGRFTADLKTDAIRYQRDLVGMPPAAFYATGQQFVMWTRPSDPFVHASEDYVR